MKTQLAEMDEDYDATQDTPEVPEHFRITGAYIQHYPNGQKIPVKAYDDGYGKVYVHRETMGITGIARARTWEEAYEIVEDEFLTVVPEDEVYEAYGFDSQEDMDKAVKSGEIPDLIEGYSYQSNSTGSGIVSHDLNGESLDLLTPELCERLNLHLEVEPV